MRPRVRGVLALTLAGLVFLVLPAWASAHAALLRTTPSASVTLNGAPAQVGLTFSEAVEPKFAIVSVTDAGGNQQTASSARRSPSNPDQLLVNLRPGLAKGWYLVFWRAISVDGHPVRGAFTFAVGPNPGPAPQFVIPSLSETAATPSLLIARWLMFLSMMSAVGLLIFRLFIARSLPRSVPGSSFRGVNRALAVAFGLAIVIVPIYLDLTTAQFALRSAFDLGNVIPLMGTSAFGRGYLDLELILLLLALAAGVAVWLDRPERAQRSVAALLALTGTLAAGAALLVVPGLVGHASQKSPRGLSVALDWTHLLAGSTWIGGLIGLTVLGFSVGARARVRALVEVVPRFSNLAFCSVVGLVATGTVVALLRLPTLSSLWSTGYGQALIAKIAFLTAALFLAANNLLRSKPRLEATRTRPALGEGAALMLRRLVGGEVALVVGALFAAGLLSSLAPPSSALGRIGSAAADVGPGPVTRTVTHGSYRLAFQIAPNKAAVPNAFQVQIQRGGQPVSGASVTSKFDMLDMEMQQQEYQLNQSAPGVYTRNAPSLVMVGHWALTFTITPPGANPFQVLVLDKANG